MIECFSVRQRKKATFLQTRWTMERQRKKVRTISRNEGQVVRVGLTCDGLKRKDDGLLLASVNSRHPTRRQIEVSATDALDKHAQASLSG